MSEEHVKGGLEKLGGRIKEAAGALTGNAELKSEGQLDQARGHAHEALGDVKDAFRDAAARLRQATSGTERTIQDETDKDRL